MNSLRIFYLFFCLVVSIYVRAHNFSAVSSNGKTLFYEITDAPNHICYVVREGDGYSSYPEGDIIIPATVVNPNDDETYTVKGVAGYAFYGCSGITSITLPEVSSFTSIGTTVGSTIGERCFEECSSLTNIVIPDNVTELCEQAFRETGLTTFTLGAGITKLPSSLFYNCDHLTHVVLPDNVQELGDLIFAGSNALKYVELGNAVTSLYANAFGNNDVYFYNTAIDTIVINTATPPTVNGDFWTELTNKAILYVPEEAVDDYKNHEQWGQFKYVYPIGTQVTFCSIKIINMTHSNIDATSLYINGNQLSSNTVTLPFLAGESFIVEARCRNTYFGVGSAQLCGVDVSALFGDSSKAHLIATESGSLEISYTLVRFPYDFTERIPSGQNLYFTVTDPINHIVKIVNQTGGRSTSGAVSYGYIDNGYAPSGAVVIPSTIIHNDIEYTITEIDTLAFSHCTSITSVSFSEGLLKIGADAFIDAHIGGELFLPESCTDLGGWAFRGNNFSAVNSGGARVLEEYVFLENPITHFKTTSHTKKLLNQFMSSRYGSGNNYHLKTVEIGENVDFVSSLAFEGCPNVESITIYATEPPTFKNDTNSAYSADSWSEFDPSGVTLYVPKSEEQTVLNAYRNAPGWMLFDHIEEMPDKYTVSVAVEEPGTGNVSGAGKYVENTNTVITAIPTAHYRFVKWTDDNTENPRHITVTSNITYTAIFKAIPTQIGDTLSGIINGKNVYFEVTSVLPNEMKLIQDIGNTRYSSLDEEVTLPSSTTDMWGDTFYLTRIGSQSLTYNSSIKRLHIPEGVRVVEAYALRNSNFEEIFFPASLDSLFDNNELQCLYLQDLHFASTDHLQYVGMYAYEENCPLYANMADSSWCIKDGVALFYKGKVAQRFEIPEGVVVLANRLLQRTDANVITSIRIPSTLKALPPEAFYSTLSGNFKTLYTRANVPPTVNPDAKPFSNKTTNLSNYKLVVDCKANMGAYQDDPYWGTQWINPIHGTTYYIDVVCNNDEFGTVTIDSTHVCDQNKIHLTANPGVEYEVTNWSTGATTTEIDVTLSSDTLITVVFAKKQFEITFLDYNDTVLYKTMVEYGEKPVYGKAAPERAPDDTYSYSFDAWDKTVVAAIENATYKAVYSSSYIDYIIRFFNYDQTRLDSQALHYGDIITYGGEIPVRPEDAQYIYTFKGFDNNFVNGVTTVNGNMTFTAEYTTTTKQYTVRFFNYDGVRLDSQVLSYGSAITYAGETPVHPSNLQYSYIFTGFNNGFKNGITTISSDTIFTAEYSETLREYTVRFFNYDGERLDSQVLHYNEIITYAGEAPIRPSDVQYTYTFKGFNNSFESGVTTISSDTVFTAEYTKTLREYTVRFFNYDGERLDSQVLSYGSAITYAGETPVRPSDVQYTYTFKGFNNGFNSGVTTISSDTIFTAEYEAVTQKYTVTFLSSEGGKQIDQLIIAYGGDATLLAPHDSLLTPPQDKRFGGWSQPIDSVKGNMTVWPLWIDKIYVVTFIDPLNQNSVIDVFDNVPYGGKVTPPAAPTHEGYIFKGWSSDAYLNVTDDVTIEAQYEQESTGLHNISSDNNRVRKQLVNGQVRIILNDGNILDASGKKTRGR